jgi:hypothetical protein
MAARRVICEQSAMRGLIALPLLAAALSLGGCFGVGMAANKAFGDKDKDGGGIVAAQEAAITAARGGVPGTDIAWSDKRSGLQGTLQRVSRAETADGCRRFNQVVNAGTETMHGTIKACPSADGKWHLQSEGVNVVNR